MGRGGPGAGAVRVTPAGSACYRKKSFFSDLHFQSKRIPEKLQIIHLKHQTYSENSQDSRKIPKETHWDTNNPNKVFGAHENDFRAF
jgi:hypothetical protein